jgi:uncharacterized phage protein (TIGR01671 family)
MLDIGHWTLNMLNQDRAVIMQYTGLKDKNGKEIYEGDVVLIDDEYTEPILDDGSGPRYTIHHISEVSYEEGAAAYIVEVRIGADFLRKGLYTLDEITKEGFDIEVIGNIYENPELLND